MQPIRKIVQLIRGDMRPDLNKINTTIALQVFEIGYRALVEGSAGTCLACLFVYHGKDKGHKEQTHAYQQQKNYDGQYDPAESTRRFCSGIRERHSGYSTA
jgi:hypothetical protein